jgi:hypothetical protein
MYGLYSRAACSQEGLMMARLRYLFFAFIITFWKAKTRDLEETIESSPLCITDLFMNKLVAYFLLITVFI